MVYTVTLDPETEQAIERKATRLGVSPSDYLRRLAERDAHRKAVRPVTPPQKSFGDQWRTAFGNRPAGTGTSNWSEVEAACDPVHLRP